jgi:hypothetical protein
MGDLLYLRRNLFVCISYYTYFILFHNMFRLLLSHHQVQFQYSVPRVGIIVHCAFDIMYL